MSIKQIFKVSSFIKVSIFGLMLFGFFNQCEEDSVGDEIIDGEITDSIPEIVIDTIATSPVTELTAKAKNQSVNLSWVNPSDADLDYIEIVVGANTFTTVLQEKTIGNLINDSAYTFILTAFDTAANASLPDTIVATPFMPLGIYPTDIMPELVRWKVNLPVDENGNDSSNATDVDDRNKNSTEIVGTDLIDFEYQPYFHLDSNEIIFRAHCAGATTGGSKYPRSELRQLVGGGNNYWSVQDYQYLYTELRITHTPVEKPEVCMVQIHGPDDEPLRVQYHAEDGLEIIYNEDYSQDITDSVSYILGQLLAITVTVENGDITCNVTNTDTNESYTKNWASSDATGYFKLGCYTQSSIFLSQFKSGKNDELMDAYGEVAVSKIVLTETY